MFKHQFLYTSNTTGRNAFQPLETPRKSSYFFLKKRQILGIEKICTPPSANTLSSLWPERAFVNPLGRGARNHGVSPLHWLLDSNITLGNRGSSGRFVSLLGPESAVVNPLVCGTRNHGVGPLLHVVDFSLLQILDFPRSGSTAVGVGQSVAVTHKRVPGIGSRLVFGSQGSDLGLCIAADSHRSGVGVANSRQLITDTVGDDV